MGAMKDNLFGDDLFEQPQPQPKLDRAEARAARDTGIKRVLDNNKQWRMSALAEIEKLHRGWIGTAEDIRINIAPKIGLPKHPNAWGGLMNAAIQRGWFERTGEWIAPKDVKSHSRPTREYRRI